MKFWQKFLVLIAVITLISTIAILIIEWKKDSALWRSIKKAIAEKDLLRL